MRLFEGGCVAFFQAPSEALREASRALMAAATAPRTFGEPGRCDTGAYMQLLLPGARPASVRTAPSHEVRDLAATAGQHLCPHFRHMGGIAGFCRQAQGHWSFDVLEGEALHERSIASQRLLHTSLDTEGGR